MADRYANIDVVFRNGLKDYEAMPPRDIWEDIKPSLYHRPVYPTLLKVAASVAVLLTLGYFSYRLGMNSVVRITNGTFSVAEQQLLEIPNASEPIVEISGNQVDDASVHSISYSVNQETPAQQEPLLQLPREVPITDTRSLDKLVPERITGFVEIDNSYISQLVKGDYNYTIEEFNSQAIEMETLSGLNEKDSEKRWSVAALASPTYYSVTSGNVSQVVISANEQPSVSYAGGVAFSYNVSKRFSVRSGIYYSAIGQQIGGISAYSGFAPYNMAKGNGPFEVSTSKGMIQSNNGDIYLADVAGDRIASDYNVDNFDPVKSDLPQIGTSLQQNFRYLELPLSLRYRIFDGFVGLNVIGGLSSNILVGNSVYLTHEDQRFDVGETEGLNNIIFSSTLGMGMEYNISSSISLNLEPMLRYFITPVSVSSPDVNPITFGIFSGISYKF